MGRHEKAPVRCPCSRFGVHAAGWLHSIVLHGRIAVVVVVVVVTMAVVVVVVVIMAVVVMVVVTMAVVVVVVVAMAVVVVITIAVVVWLSLMWQLVSFPASYVFLILSGFVPIFSSPPTPPSSSLAVMPSGGSLRGHVAYQRSYLYSSTIHRERQCLYKRPISPLKESECRNHLFASHQCSWITHDDSLLSVARSRDQAAVPPHEDALRHTFALQDSAACRFARGSGCSV